MPLEWMLISSSRPQQNFSSRDLFQTFFATIFFGSCKFHQAFWLQITMPFFLLRIVPLILVSGQLLRLQPLHFFVLSSGRLITLFLRWAGCATFSLSNPPYDFFWFPRVPFFRVTTPPPKAGITPFLWPVRHRVTAGLHQSFFFGLFFPFLHVPG